MVFFSFAKNGEGLWKGQERRVAGGKTFVENFRIFCLFSCFPVLKRARRKAKSEAKQRERDGQRKQPATSKNVGAKSRWRGPPDGEVCRSKSRTKGRSQRIGGPINRKTNPSEWAWHSQIGGKLSFLKKNIKKMRIRRVNLFFSGGGWWKMKNVFQFG